MAMPMNLLQCRQIEMTKMVRVEGACEVLE